MRDFSAPLAELRRRVADAYRYLKVDDARVRIAGLEGDLGRPDLWDDAEHARQVTSEHARLRGDVDLVERLERQVSDLETLFELAREEDDDSVAGEITAGVRSLERELDGLELRSLFTGEHDERDAICTIQAGAGGTDAQDWAEMMLRMYGRWAEQRGFEFELDEVQPGVEAGILSATFTVQGRHAYGLLVGERGTHRLVRISPFDAQARRHTAFAAFAAVPALDDSEDVEDVEINDKDLRVDTFRSSGAGGQHVNVTDSAVRITHLPTGIVVACQAERSQHQNKARALQILAARLAERARHERRRELEELSGAKTEVAWGNQIRSYVLAPYQLVKDLRTEHETGNVDAVLDGDLDPFIEAYLHWRRAQGEPG